MSTETSALQARIDSAADLFAAKLARNNETPSSAMCSWLAAAMISEGGLRPLLVTEAVKQLRERGLSIDEGSKSTPRGYEVTYTLRAGAST